MNPSVPPTANRFSGQKRKTDINDPVMMGKMAADMATAMPAVASLLCRPRMAACQQQIATLVKHSNKAYGRASSEANIPNGLP